MSRRLGARVTHLEGLIATSEVVTTEQGVRIAVAPHELLDAWLRYMSQEPLGVQRTTLWALATAVVPPEDWQMTQLKAAARAELAAQEDIL
jgi:hypothetical protein